MAEALRIAIVGAAGTGKTRLAGELRDRLAATLGGPVALVPPGVLRGSEDRDETDPVPTPETPGAIARSWQARIDDAGLGHAIVVCDDLPQLNEAVVRPLDDVDRPPGPALRLPRDPAGLTLLMAIDLPPPVDRPSDLARHQESVDGWIRAVLGHGQQPFAVVAGRGGSRLLCAWSAVRPWLLARGLALPEWPPEPGPATLGLDGTAKVETDEAEAAARRWAARRWRCECCLPEAEQASRPLRPTAASAR